MGRRLGRLEVTIDVDGRTFSPQVMGIAFVFRSRGRSYNSLATGRSEHLGYTGLNWKSLTQPAILPLTTDYMPNLNKYTTCTSGSSEHLIAFGQLTFPSLISCRCVTCRSACPRDLLIDVRTFNTEENASFNCFINFWKITRHFLFSVTLNSAY